MPQIPPSPDDGPLSWLALTIIVVFVAGVVWASWHDLRNSQDDPGEQLETFVLFEGCRVPVEERK